MKKNCFVLLLIFSTINSYAQQTNWHKTQKKLGNFFPIDSWRNAYISFKNT